VENIFVGADFSPEKIRIYMDLFKEFHDVFSWSYEEMPGIDPRVIEHEIMTYPDAKPVQHKLHPVNPKKATTIKVEVEKLLKTGFIYPVQLTQWVSNPVPVNKK
jgi:oligoendopeptidase F